MESKVSTVVQQPKDKSWRVSLTRDKLCFATCSFSWSQALQLPLLDLCKGKGELQLDEMSKLYVEELTIAGAAARGEHEWAKGEGDHSP